MTCKHPHEEVILAYYRGEIIQGLDSSSCNWVDYPRYDPNSIKISERPSFSAQFSYRLKPRQYEVTLSQEEVEVIWALLRKVGGNPNNTARKHSDKVYYKLENILTPCKINALANWKGMEIDEGGIRINAQLP